MKGRFISRAIAFLGAGLVWGFALGSQAADATRGHQLAAAWCEACHVPSADRKPGTLIAPALETLAESLPSDAKVLSQRLLSSHPQMPDRALSRDEAADIADYILSLRK